MHVLSPRVAAAVAITAMIMCQLTIAIAVDNEDNSDTPTNRLRFFLLSLLLRPQSTAATAAATTSNAATSSQQPTGGNATNSGNTYVTLYNTTNTSGISITRRLRIIHESDMAKLEFVDENGENPQITYLPDYYFDFFRSILSVFRERTGKDMPLEAFEDV